MKILIIPSKALLPIQSGMELRVYNLLRPLCSKHEISLLCFAPEGEQAEEPNVNLRKLFHKVELVPKEKSKVQKIGLLRRLCGWLRPPADSDDHLTFDSPQGQLYVNFTPLALENDWVTIYTIRVNRQLVGFEYLLRHDNSYLLQRCDYDEEYSYYSPGNSLRIAILKNLFDKPETYEYDMGGDDDPYKLEWCGKIHKHVTVTLGNRNIKGRAVMFVKNKALPFLRSLKGSLGNNSGVERA